MWDNIMNEFLREDLIKLTARHYFFDFESYEVGIKSFLDVLGLRVEVSKITS